MMKTALNVIQKNSMPKILRENRNSCSENRTILMHARINY